jgi:hypothetical protein
MGMQIDLETVALDPDVARYVLELRKLKAEEAVLKDRMAEIRQHIESAMGESTVALVDGAPAVTWKFVESERIDVKRVRELLPPQALDAILIKSTSRRFVILDGSEVY